MEKTLITRKEMEAIAPKTKALETLINRMKELDQGKCSLDKFEAARDAKECHVCFKLIEEGTICKPCERKIAREKAAQEAQLRKTKQWNKLLKDLRKLDKTYTLSSVKRFVGTDYQIERKKGAHKCTIYSYEVTGSGRRFHYYKGKNVLRIATDKHSVAANRLMNGFDAKNIAEKLHKKCEELFTTLELKDSKANDEQSKAKAIINRIKAAFPNATEFSHRYTTFGHGAHKRHKMNGYDFVNGIHRISTNDGKTFNITTGMLSIEKMNAVLNILNQ